MDEYDAEARRETVEFVFFHLPGDITVVIGNDGEINTWSDGRADTGEILHIGNAYAVHQGRERHPVTNHHHHENLYQQGDVERR